MNIEESDVESLETTHNLFIWMLLRTITSNCS